MIIRVEFINPQLRDFVMEGDHVDYVIQDDFVVITSDPQSEKPAKRVTFPIREVHGIFEHNIDE